MGGKRDLFKNWLLSCFILALTLGISGPAFAEDEEDEFMLEEITVTAEKREAELQKIPIDITVVRPDDMNRLGVYTVEELDEILPDVSADEMAGSFVAVTIRNVQTNFWNPIHETTVAMHMDGVQLTRANGLNDMFFDLQRLEVLKGPQGTLYGRGSTAGSMNIISQKPILNEMSGFATIEKGNFDKYRTEAALNVPITEKIAMRFAGRTMRQDGLDDSNFGDRNQWGGRISTNWEITDKQQVVAVFDFEGHEDNGFSMGSSLFGAYGKLWIVPNPMPTTGVYGRPDFDVLRWGPVKQVKLPWQTRWYVGDQADAAFNDNNGWGTSLTYDAEFGIGYFTAIYGHRVLKEKKAWTFQWMGLAGRYYGSLYAPNVDPDSPYRDAVFLNSQYNAYQGTPNAVISETSSHFDSLELRLLSKQTITQGDKYEWVFGGVGSIDDVVEVNSGMFNPSWVRIQNYSQALFGQASYSILQDWNLTGGYRYSWDHKNYSGSTGGMNSHAYDPNHADWDFETNKNFWNKSDYKATLSWVASDDVMSYLTYSKGTKNGNIDYEGGALPVETLLSWEAGVRSTWFNNKLRINASSYLYNYKNQNNWQGVTKCEGYRDYNADGSEQYVVVGVDGDGNDITHWATQDTPDVTDAPTLRLAHTCVDVSSSSTYNRAGADGVDGTDDDNYPTTLPDALRNVDDWTPGDPDWDDNDWDFNKSVALSAGGQEQIGVSVDGTWMLTQSDTVSLRASWSNSKYKSYNMIRAILAKYPWADNPYTNDALQDTRDGEDLPGQTHLRGNVSYNHMTFVGMDMLMFNIMANFTGQQDDLVVNRNTDNEYYMPGRDEYWILNTSVSYGSSKWVPEGMRWNARLQVNNLMDSDFFASINYSGDRGQWDGYNIDPNSGTYGGSFVQPRTWSFTFTLNF